jgi:hypothetical protein
MSQRRALHLLIFEKVYRWKASVVVAQLPDEIVEVQSKRRRNPGGLGELHKAHNSLWVWRERVVILLSCGSA